MKTLRLAIFCALAVIAGAVSSAQGPVIGIQPVPTSIWCWDAVNSQWRVNPNTSTLEAAPFGASPVAWYGFNSSLGQYTPYLYNNTTGQCTDPFTFNGVTSVSAILPLQVENGGSPGQGPLTGDVTVLCQNNSCGGQGDLAMHIIPPIDGQHVTIFAADPPVLSGSNCVTVTANANSPFDGSITRSGSGALAGCDQNVSATYTHFPLPSYVNPANVTAIYAGTVEQVSCGLNSTNDPLDTCGAWSVTANSNQIGPTLPTAVPLTTYTALLCSSCGSFNYTTAQFVFNNSSTTEWAFLNPLKGFSSTFVPFLIVYYTGSAPPANNQVQIGPCLSYNQGILDSINPCNVGADTNSLTTANVYQANIPGFGTAPPVGTQISIQAGAANTSTTPTFALNGGPAMTIVSPTGGALCTTVSGGGPDIGAGQPMNLTVGLGVYILTNQRQCFGSSTPVTWPPTSDVVVSNGTNAPAGIAPGSSGNALCSNGTAWVSSTSCVGGGSGGSVIPSNAQFIFTGISVNDDDQHNLSTAVPITSWSTTAGVTTVTATNTFTSGQWISMRFATGWPSPPVAYALGTNYTLFQVSATGLSGSQFQINTSLISAGNCAASCGNVYDAMGYLPFATASQQAFPTGSLNRTYMFLPANVTIQGLNAGFSAMFPSSGGQINCPVSVPTYLVINNHNNDPWTGRTDTQIEGDYQGVFQKAHTCGMTVVIGSGTATFQDQTFSTGAYTYWDNVQNWLRGQGKTQASPTQFAAGQYWDIPADIGNTVNNAYDAQSFNQSNHGLAPGGVQLMAAGIASAMASGASMMAPQTTPWFGTIGDNESSAADGQVYRSLSDVPYAFQWTNAANSQRYMVLGKANAGNNPVWLILGGGSSTTPGQFEVLGNPNFGNNFAPLAQFIDLSGNPFNSAVKQTVFGNPITPSGNIYQNNYIATFAAVGENRGGPPSIPAGHGVDFGFNYNSSGTPSLNSMFFDFAGDTNDAIHLTAGPTVCLDVPTVENPGGQEGCPTGATYVFGVGGSGSTPPPFQVTSAGDVTVHTQTVHVFTVSTLPACSAAGLSAAVSDATAPTYLGTLTGGGTVFTPVVCNGSSWMSY
jgi:hypothetical protein